MTDGIYGLRPMRKVALVVAVLVCVGSVFALTLEEGFKAPPDSAKPHTWYHMMNGNVTKEGITCDFEALAEAGIGGVQMFDAGCAVPPGPLKFNSDDWFDMFAHAHREAKRLGLEICIPNCSGWSSSGGPWNPPANGMKVVSFTETAAKGPSRFSGKLPRTAKDNGFYEDIAVLAYPTPKGDAKIGNLAAKAFFDRGNVNRDEKPAAKDAIVAKDSVIDLTAKMKKDGSIEWDVPAGDWTLLRIGYICNGRCNHPASEKGRGLEVDKLSASAMDYHFEQYVARLCRTLGIESGKINETGFNNILVDSYEVNVQNWTQGFGKTFEKRMGYSLVRYLPVLAGRIVGSKEESERFLEDFRRVVATSTASSAPSSHTATARRTTSSMARQSTSLWPNSGPPPRVARTAAQTSATRVLPRLSPTCGDAATPLRNPSPLTRGRAAAGSRLRSPSRARATAPSPPESTASSTTASRTSLGPATSMCPA